MAVVGVVLLIACANLATLVLSRTAARQRELGVRLAIGAGRSRLARQLLTESLLLSAAGAVLGLGLATWGGSIVMGLASGDAGLRAVDLRPDLTVLAFTSAVALIVAVLLALGSVWHLARLDPQRRCAARWNDRRPPGWHACWCLARWRWRPSCWSAPACWCRRSRTSCTPTSGSGATARHADDQPPARRLRCGAHPSFMDALGARLEALPGVTSVTARNRRPARSGTPASSSVPGFESAAPMQRTAGRHRAGARVVETWGLTLRRGRDLATSDEAQPTVALVNESFATALLRDRRGRSAAPSPSPATARHRTRSSVSSRMPAIGARRTRSSASSIRS